MCMRVLLPCRPNISTHGVDFVIVVNRKYNALPKQPLDVFRPHVEVRNAPTHEREECSALGIRKIQVLDGFDILLIHTLLSSPLGILLHACLRLH